MAKRLRSNRSMRTSAIARSVTRQLSLELRDLLGPSLKEIAKPTFKALADSWMDANAPRLVEPANERRHIDHMESLWELREGELTPRSIRRVFALLGKSALAPGTINKLRSTGKRIIAEAQESGIWGQLNPFAVVRRAKEKRRAYRTLSIPEILRVLPHLRADRRREALVSLIVGIRPGELLGLKKEDVSLEKGVVLIRRSHGRSQTKTGKERRFPIPDIVMDDLRAAMDESPSEYVFPRNDGTGRRQPQGTKLAKTLQTALGKAGIVSGYKYSCRRRGCGYKDTQPKSLERFCPKCNFKLWVRGEPERVRFYDLRHSAATLHRNAGADPVAIKLTLGWAMRDVGDDIYSHLTDEDVRRELNKLRLTGEDETMLSANAVTRAWEARALPTELPPRSLRPGVQTDPLLTVKDVAERLRVTRALVYRLLERKEIRAHRVGSLYRVQEGDLSDFLTRGRK